MERHIIAHRAQTPEQKREIIERLYTLWQAHPDLRLGQLILNAYSTDSVSVEGSIYHGEDFHFINNLERFYSPLQGEGE